MASEVTYATHAASTRLAAQIHEALGLLLDGVVDLRRVVRYRGNIAQLGSAVSRFAQVRLDDSMAADTELGTVANTDHSTAKADVTIARQDLQREYSHLLALTRAAGQFGPDPVLMARDAYNAGMLRFAAMIAGLHATVSTEVGATGVNLSVDTIYDGVFALNLNNAEMAGLTSLLHGQQINDFRTSLRGEADITLEPAGLNALMAQPIGFKFGWRGINFWQSDQVPTANAGADRDGCICAPGAFAYADADPAALASLPGIDVASLVPGVPIWTQFGHNASQGSFTATYNWYLGVGEEEDLRAVRVISDA